MVIYLDKIPGDIFCDEVIVFISGPWNYAEKSLDLSALFLLTQII